MGLRKTIADTRERSESFRLMALESVAHSALTVYVQPSQWAAFSLGQHKTVTISSVKQFPFTLPLEMVP